MAENLRRQKIHLLSCAFLVSGHGIFKMHLYPVVFLVFWRCVFFESFLVYLRCDFDQKMYIFFTRLAPVSRPGVFFYALGTCVLRRCIYFPRVWKSDLYFYCICICFTRACRTGCVFFGKCIFGLHLWEKENHIFAASVFWRHIFSQGQAYFMIVLRQLESLSGLEISTIWLYVRQIRNN